MVSVLKAVIAGHEKTLERVLKQHEEANSRVMLEMKKNRDEMSKLVGLLIVFTGLLLP